MSNTILNLSKRLLNLLNSNSIDYCNWKDNHEIIRSLSGDEDLDLLVRKEHYSHFIKIIYSLGFKEAKNKNITFPFIYHYYGLDDSTGKLLHLHVHLKIITGESHTKNYHLPLENIVLSTDTRYVSGCKVPSPECELILFIIRYYIKISCLPGAFLVWKRSHSFHAEFSQINQQINLNKVDELLKQNFTIIPFAFFIEMYEGYKSPINPLKKVIIALKLRTKISSLRRNGYIASICFRYYQVFYRIIKKLILKRKKTLVKGGAIIAITGLDATGKSTLASEIEKWLGGKFDVFGIHVGSPKARIETVLFRAMLKMRKRGSQKSESYKIRYHHGSFVYAIRYLVLAYERYKLLIKANRSRSTGYIVICDRYPSLVVGKMDSPRIGNNHEGNNFFRFLGRLEKRLYDSIPTPNAIYNLQVPMNVAIERNRTRLKDGKETTQNLIARYTENTNLRYKALNFEVIDTSQKYPFVLKALKEKIWSII